MRKIKVSTIRKKTVMKNAAAPWAKPCFEEMNSAGTNRIAAATTSPSRNKTAPIKAKL